MKTMFSRQFALTACLIMLSVAALGLAFRVFIGSYAAEQAERTLQHNADVVTGLASAYDSAETLGASWDVRINLSFASEVADTDAVICDLQGRVMLCSCDTLYCEHLGLQLEPEFVQQVLETGPISFHGRINGLYSDRRYMIAEPIVSRTTEQSIGFVMVSETVAQTHVVISETTDFFLMMGLAVLLVAMLAVSLLVRSQYQPLRDMAAAARRFGHGELDVRVATGGSNTIEIDELAVAFNNMAASLEKSELQRREFVANVSHELKTPMTTIAGFMDGMLDGTIPPEQHRHYMQIISDEVRRLSRLVRSMLEISRMQSQGMDETRLRRFDLTETVGQVLISFEQRIIRKRILVDVQMPDRSVWTKAEPDSITQVCYNLADNAIKFCNEGGLLRIQVEPEGSKIRVTFQNSGPTVDPAELPLLFDRFHKTDKSRSADREGVGLGLYIVKTILNSHGEDITVTSENGLTTFVFTLPAVR